MIPSDQGSQFRSVRWENRAEAARTVLKYSGVESCN